MQKNLLDKQPTVETINEEVLINDSCYLTPDVVLEFFGKIIVQNSHG